MSARAAMATIAIPTYNRVDVLEQAVVAARAQTYRSTTLLICDNGSTDGTEAFCRDLVARDGAVRYVRHPVNLGPTANFNAASGAAEGDYFMWLADDDWIPPDYLEQCIAVLRAEPAAALVAGVPRYFEDEVFAHEGVRVDALDPDPVRRVLDFYRQVIDNGTIYGVMPMTVVRQLSPLEVRMGGDWLLMAEVAALGEIRTLPTTEIRRDLVGGYTFKRMAEVGGLSTFEGRFPYVAIAAFAAWAPASGSAVYRHLGSRRFGLAVRSAAVIFRRFVITGLRWRSLRRRARSLGARLRPATAGDGPGRDQPDR